MRLISPGPRRDSLACRLGIPPGLKPQRLRLGSLGRDWESFGCRFRAPRALGCGFLPPLLRQRQPVPQQLSMLSVHIVHRRSRCYARG